MSSKENNNNLHLLADAVGTGGTRKSCRTAAPRKMETSSSSEEEDMPVAKKARKTNNKTKRSSKTNNKNKPTIAQLQASIAELEQRHDSTVEEYEEQIETLSDNVKELKEQLKQATANSKSLKQVQKETLEIKNLDINNLKERIKQLTDGTDTTDDTDYKKKYLFFRTSTLLTKYHPMRHRSVLENSMIKHLYNSRDTVKLYTAYRAHFFF